MDKFEQNVIDWGMKLLIKTVKDAEEIHSRMVELDIKASLGSPYDMPHYRGEQKFGWDLLPNILRLTSVQSDKSKAKEIEKKGWQSFEKVIKAKFGNDALRTIFDNEKHGQDWDLLMQAQHAGVKTSLMDWSPNVYAPLYFATEESLKEDIESADAQFWAFMVPFRQIKSHNEFPVKDSFYEDDPQSLQNGCMINVSILLDDLTKRKYETRMFHQKGRFYVSSDDQWGVAMNKQPELMPLIFRFRIPAENKASIRAELKERGIDYNYLYGPFNPDHQQLIDDLNNEVYVV